MDWAYNTNWKVGGTRIYIYIYREREREREICVGC
jgi:hypothetical protein